MRKSLLIAPCVAALIVLGVVGPAKAESFRAFGVQAVVSPDRPSGVTVNPRTNMVYTVNAGDGSGIGHGGSVTVINGNTNAVVGSPIPVGSSPYAIAANPTNNSVYVTDAVDGTVSVISGDIPAVTKVIPLNIFRIGDTGVPADVDVQAYGLAVDPLANRVYVDLAFTIHDVAEIYGSLLMSIDSSTDTLAVRSEVTARLGEHPGALATNPVTGLVYMAMPFDNVVEVRDGKTLDKLSEIPAVQSPESLGVNSSTNTVYIPDSHGYTVAVVDGATNTLQRTINVGSHPFGVGINELTNTIYVPNTRGDSVAVIDGVTNDITGTPINVGTFPVGVAVNAARKTLYVANQGDSTVSAITERSTPDITSAPPVPGKTGLSYSFVITAAGSPPPILSVSSGVLPPGLVFNGSTGVLSGRPTRAGSYTFTVTAHNVTSFDQKKTYTLVIAP